MTLCAVDLGSNTLKTTVARFEGPELSVLWEEATVTRIGQGLDQSGRLADEAMDRTFHALERHLEAAKELGASSVRIVATAGMRGAENAEVFLHRVRSALGAEIEIIDGLREAELAFRAPAARFGPGPVCVLDVGGRSTELIFGEGSEVEARVSLEMGGVRLTERFLLADPPADSELDAAQAFIDETLKDAPVIRSGTTLVGVSGTILSLLGLQMGTHDLREVVERGEGNELTRASAERSYDELRVLPAHRRIRGTVIPEGRADVIVAGTLVVLRVLEHYRLDRMRVSNRGVRYGLLEEMRG